MISIFRCDDRLIHGQCIVKVISDYHVKKILLVDKFTAENPVIKSVYRMAVPPNVKVEILTPDDAWEKIEQAKAGDVNTLILVKDPKVALDIFKNVQGLKKELNIGPMSSRRGTIKVTFFSNLLKEEVLSVEELDKLGVRVYFQQVSDEKAVEWGVVKDKILSSIQKL